MNNKTFLFAALVTTFGLGFASVAGAADARLDPRGAAARQDVSVQAEPLHGSGHMALSEDRAAAARAAGHTQAVPGDRSSSAQAPVRALNQEIYSSPYTY